MTLKYFFHPRSIAVIGASRLRTKIGHTVVQNILGSGYRGTVIPVNPKAKNVLGLKCYPSVEAVRRAIDVAIIAIPAPLVPDALVSCGKKKIPFVIVISSGFKELGPEGLELEQKLQSIAKRYHIRLLGPNCLGIVNTWANLNLSFAGEYPVRGGVSFVSQSGAILVSLIDWSLETNVGLNKLVSLGNESDLTEIDVISYLEHDPTTSVIGLYLEQMTDIPRFMELVSRVTLKKPVVIIHAGESAAAQRAMKSHTGSLATPAAVSAGLFRQVGAIEVTDIEDLFNVIHLFSNPQRNQQLSTVILSNAGGPGIIAVDELEQTKLQLAPLAPELQTKLRRTLPHAASVANPIDIMGDADLNRFKKTLNILVQDRTIGNICIIITPQTVTPIVPMAQVIARVQKRTDKHIVACFIGGRRVASARRIFAAHDTLYFAYTYDAIRTLASSKAHYLPHVRYHAPKVQNRPTRREQHTMPYAKMQRLLITNRFPLVRGMVVNRVSDISRIRSFPVACKVLASDVIHKKSAGGVRLSVMNKSEMLKLWHTWQKTFAQSGFQGMLAQPMAREGIELIIGAQRDSRYGVAIMVGIGGSFAEAVHDVAFRVAPLGVNDAGAMLAELKGQALLRNSDRRFVALLLDRLSRFVIHHPEIRELDFNPVVVYAKGGCIIDARIVV